jgi:hypothetical protein
LALTPIWGVESGRDCRARARRRSRSRIRSLGVFLPFLLIVCVLSGGLAWLGWSVLEQDRALQNQRALERLGVDADAAGTALLRILVEARDALGQMEAAPVVGVPECTDAKAAAR